jgi:hypothetical protein
MSFPGATIHIHIDMPRRRALPHPRRFVRRIISGGQTGADRAALDAAIELGIPHGGWVPRGRWAEDGKLPERYQVQETGSRRLDLRTEWNVRDADATLIFTTDGKLTGGTALTAHLARTYRKPWMHVNLSILTRVRQRQALKLMREWLAATKPAVVNVAGPRASKDPKVYRAVRRYLLQLFAENGKR